MKHSIKRQMTVVFSGLIIFILVMMFLVYSKCLETYYIMHKESDLLEVHKTVGTALAQGNKEDERAWKVMERTNISMLVLQDNQVIFSPRGDQEQLVSQLRGYVFNQNQDEGELLKSTDNYEIRKIRDSVAGIDYLEMWGTYSNGAIFILRSPLDSIWESTALANKLLVYVGIAALCWEEFWYLCLRERSQSRSQSLLPFPDGCQSWILTQGTTEAEKMRSERSGIISILCPSVWRRQFRN